jgi:hypothetical protein
LFSQTLFKAVIASVSEAIAVWISDCRVQIADLKEVKGHEQGLPRRPGMPGLLAMTAQGGHCERRNAIFEFLVAGKNSFHLSLYTFHESRIKGPVDCRVGTNNVPPRNDSMYCVVIII